MAKVTEIDFSHKYNTVIFDDTDSRSDYFNIHNVGLKTAIKYVKEYGAPRIRVTVTNNDHTIPAIFRMNRICKEAGYKIVEDHKIEKAVHPSEPEKLIAYRKTLRWYLIKV